MRSFKVILTFALVTLASAAAVAQSYYADDATFKPITQIGTQLNAKFNYITDFSGVADGVTNNYTTLQAACNGSGGAKLFVPAGTYAVTVPASTSLCTVPANTVIEGAGKGVTVLNLTTSDTAYTNIFVLANANVTFKNMTINLITASTVNTTLFGLQASNIRFENCAFISNSVEGARIGGTATNLDTVNIIFSSTALAGSPITISYTVTTGLTTAQIAQGLVNAVNANATITGAGISATLDGSFVKINQPDTLIPQASYTTSVTGAATETLTVAASAGMFFAVVGGSEASDFSMINTDVIGFSYVFLKANATTTTNRRWTIRGGYINKNIHGGVNINSPSGYFDGLIVEGVTIGAIGLNQTDSLPIALAHVSGARIIGNKLIGTYQNNAMHFEENVSQLVVANNIVMFTTSTSLGVGYSGTGIYFVDNNIGGTGYKAVNDVTITGNVFASLTANISGYGIWNTSVSAAHLRHTVAGNVFTGYAGGIRYDVANGITIVGNQLTNNAASGTGIVLGGGVTYATVSQNMIRNYATSLTTSATLSVTRDNYGVPTSGAAVTPGVSPWTYTAGSSPEDHYFKAGTITSLVQAGRTIATAFPIGGNAVSLHLEPNESYVLTYTVAPTIDRVTR
jgi:hypothetical protein